MRICTLSWLPREERTNCSKNYESLLAALVSRFNAHGLSLRLPEHILVFMLMTSAGIADNHRVSILVAVSNDVCTKEEDEWSVKASVDNVSNVYYETVPSLLQQCQIFSVTNCGGGGIPLNANYGSIENHHVRRLSANRLGRLKIKISLQCCKKYGH